MHTAQPSRTALLTATVRGDHRRSDAPPWVLDDPFAHTLVGPGWPQLLAGFTALFSPPVFLGAKAILVVRSRYAEDRLAAGLFTQYVILGAGLDSFAWRRPDLLGSLRVFEVDHPATQAWKQERAAAVALPLREGHFFAPVNLETDTLWDGLAAVGFDWAQPTLFSWLGVTMYLTTDAIEATLRTVAACAPGSEIALSYAVTRPFLDPVGREFRATIERVIAQGGEPLQTDLTPEAVEALLVRCGLTVADHPTPDDLDQRYFAARTDGLRPFSAERLIAAVVAR